MLKKFVPLGGSRGFFLLGVAWVVVVAAGLFVPLMDNDSAHHANIALRMYFTGDYIRLIDYDGPYLDKPHLHFWLSALSYHVFGVNGFAYKFPTFLFSLIGIWAVYRSSVIMVGEAAGRIAASVYATSVAFLLGLNDVRMDGILTAGVAISIWQIAGYINKPKTKYALGAALGMAIGFCTKGHIGVFIPVLFFIARCLFDKKTLQVLRFNLLWGVLAFFILIGPVVFCYYLQFNLHPELVVRGKDHVDGVRFILLDQTLGRYGGEMGADAKGDRLFFFHTFLWVFAPWGLVGLLFLLLKRGLRGMSSLSTSALFVLVVFGVLVGFSSFKLPHYLNIILPIASFWIADVLGRSWIKIRSIVVGVEWLLWAVVGVFTQFLLIWWFPDQPTLFWVGFIFFLVLVFYNTRKERVGPGGYVIRYGSVMMLLFWMMNAGFYPSLLKYQGGNRLALEPVVRSIQEPIYSLEGCYSSSFYFYNRSIRKEIKMSGLETAGGYLLLDEKQTKELDERGIQWEKVASALDYEITRLNGTFLNRTSRNSTCTRLLLVRFCGPLKGPCAG